MSNPVAGVPRILANRDKSRKRDARRERERERERERPVKGWRRIVRLMKILSLHSS